jgi:hypothetical protein
MPVISPIQPKRPFHPLPVQTTLHVGVGGNKGRIIVVEETKARRRPVNGQRHHHQHHRHQPHRGRGFAICDLRFAIGPWCVLSVARCRFLHSGFCILHSAFYFLTQRLVEAPGCDAEAALRASAMSRFLRAPAKSGLSLRASWNWRMASSSWPFLKRARPRL